MSVLDRVFGSCFRSWVWGNTETGHQKYIDYLPTRKWRYNDQTLMNELTDNNSWDIMDLADDDLLNDAAPRNVTLRIDDNVFINPLNPANDNNNAHSDHDNTLIHKATEDLHKKENEEYEEEINTKGKYENLEEELATSTHEEESTIESNDTNGQKTISE